MFILAQQAGQFSDYADLCVTASALDHMKVGEVIELVGKNSTGSPFDISTGMSYTFLKIHFAGKQKPRFKLNLNRELP